MRKRNRRRIRGGSIFILLGIILILSATSLCGYNVWEADRADRASQAVEEQLEEAIREEIKAAENDPQLQEIREKEKEYPDRTMPAKEIKENPSGSRSGSGSAAGRGSGQTQSYRYIGTLNIPSANLNLPVMEEWDYTRLKIAPCRYSGSVYQNNLVIAGHNYHRHFSPLRTIKIGVAVNFTDVEGNVYHYRVANRETLQPTMVETLLSDDLEEWDLTLFTCNSGGQTRCVVRCQRID